MESAVSSSSSESVSPPPPPGLLPGLLAGFNNLGKLFTSKQFSTLFRIAVKTPGTAEEKDDVGDSKLPVYYSEVLFHLSCTQSATKYENKSLKYSSFFLV